MRSVVALLIALPALLLAAPAAADSADPPSSASSAISVTVSDGVDAAAAGDELQYVVRVENTGSEHFAGTLVLRAPEFAEIEASDAAVEGSTATWKIEVRAGSTDTREAVVTITGESGDAYQVVSLAEVVDERGTILVRAADADAIAGAQAPPAVAGLSAPGERLPEWVAVAAVVVAVILSVGALAMLGVVAAGRHRPRSG